MAVITITSDYGLKDHYVAALKGVLHRELEHPQIVDVTHQITAFDLFEAAFILRNAYKHFPEGTVHLICVDEEALADRKHIVAYMDKHYFIAANNGVISMINPDLKPEKIVEIDLRNTPELTSTRDIFARVAGHLVRGGKADLLGKQTQDYKTAIMPNPIFRAESKLLIGTVIYIDRFGNLVTNISKKQVQEDGQGRDFRIALPNRRKPITKVLQHYYEETDDGKAIAIFNAAGLLEIAIFKSGTDTFGGASDLLGIRKNDQINIEFL